MRGLRWSQEHLREHAQARAADLEAAAAEGRAEVIEDIKEVSETLSK